MLVTDLCMISCVFQATKLLNKSRTAENSKDFPSEREPAINYTRCCVQYFFYS